MSDDVIPLGVTRLSLTLAPLVGDSETILPVGEFEGLVEGNIFGHALLHGGGAFQIILPLFRVVADEVGHELSGSLYLFTICHEGFFRRVRPIQLFSQIDVMGLLPDEERTGVRGGLACPGISHLHPTYALETLTLRDSPGYGVGGIVIPFEHLSDVLRMVPESEVNQMPPGHLQVRTTEPGIIGETRFLWGHVIRTIDLGEIL